MAILIACRKISNRLPAPNCGLVVWNGRVFVFKLPVETVATRFGGIPSGLPHLAIPGFLTGLVHGLLGPAVTVAMLSAIESLMSAMVSPTSARVRSRQVRG